MDSEKHRRLLRAQRERRFMRRSGRNTESTAATPSSPSASHARRPWYERIYHDRYKELLWFTFGMLFLSLCVIGYTYLQTGDVIYKGVSLSGGVTVTISTQGLTPLNVKELGEELRATFPEQDIHTREISEFGVQQGITIEASARTGDPQEMDALARQILSHVDIPSAASRSSVEATGPALGETFFEQTIKAVLIAFICMGFVVFIYFGERLPQKALATLLTVVEGLLIWYANNPIVIAAATLVGMALVYLYIRYSVPSSAVVLCAFSTMVFTIAVMDLMRMRISTAGIAAFLMLIGYSVDTDILLSTRALKSSSGTVYQRIVSTMKTGLTMTGTTIAAALIALLFTQSDVIKEIMTITIIGLFADIFYTWVQNSAILRIYLERKGRTADES